WSTWQVPDVLLLRPKSSLVDQLFSFVHLGRCTSRSWDRGRVGRASIPRGRAHRNGQGSLSQWAFRRTAAFDSPDRRLLVHLLIWPPRPAPRAVPHGSTAPLGTIRKVLL